MSIEFRTDILLDIINRVNDIKPSNLSITHSFNENYSFIGDEINKIDSNIVYVTLNNEGVLGISDEKGLYPIHLNDWKPKILKKYNLGDPNVLDDIVKQLSEYLK